MYSALDLVFVEDNPTDAQFFERAVRKYDPACRIHRCHDGQVAVDFVTAIAANHDPLPKLLVLDIKLPKLLGFDVLRAVRANEHTAYLPAVMMSSSTQQEDIDLAYALGANGYLNKPPTMQGLNQAVGCLIEFWVRSNRTRAGH